MTKLKTKTSKTQKFKTPKPQNFVYYGRVGLDLNSLGPKRPRLDPDENLAWRDTLWMGFYRQVYGQMNFPKANDLNCCVLGAKYIIERDFFNLVDKLCYYGRDKNILGECGVFNKNIVIVFKSDDSSNYEELKEKSLMALNDDVRLTFKELAFLIGYIF